MVVRRGFTFVAALAVAACFVPMGSGTALRHATAAHRTVALHRAASTRASELPTLYVEYTMTCTFSIVDDSGKPVTAIAPGTYEIEVQTPVMFKLVDTLNQAPGDETGCRGWAQFQLTGPGVNVATTLDTGCDSNYIIPATVFKANSTYNAVDLNQPTVAHSSFTTLSTGTPTAGASPYGTGTGTRTSSASPIGEDVGKTKTKIIGTLTGGLTVSGTPTLTLKGKPVTALAAGRYSFVITDKDPKGSFTIQPVTGTMTKDLTSPQFVGRHTVAVNLTAGRWMYFSGLGKAHYVLVS
jgi:hypothetical protein